MGGASLLLRVQHHHPPSPHPHFPKKLSPLPSSSLYFALPTANTPRGAFLVARAELPDGEKGRSSDDTSAPPPPPKNPFSGKGAGFGGGAEAKKKRRGGGKERSSVIRRSPIERPSLFYSNAEEGRSLQDKNQGANESAFLLTWLGLGSLILVEGIALAASGFLPEEWDNFLVKYLYPSFTPTVFFFVGGTVTYGVIKYLQGEKMKS